VTPLDWSVRILEIEKFDDKFRRNEKIVVFKHKSICSNNKHLMKVVNFFKAYTLTNLKGNTKIDNKRKKDEKCYYTSN